jgi:hypothetical protein
MTVRDMNNVLMKAYQNDDEVIATRGWVVPAGTFAPD